MSEQPPTRYAPQFALPEAAFVPGRGARPTRAEQGSSYLPAAAWRDNVEYLWGVDLYNCGYAWEAHEVWEGLWRAAKHDETQATFLQGLIQCAAACVKNSMADMQAAQRLAERGLGRLSRVRAQQGDHYMGLNIARYGEEHAANGGSAVGRKLWLDV